ncbi:MAG: ABC transporter permease [Clostridia bacterium]|nr:ABC transporter permease [Clostridia bacterium]
MNKFTRNTIKDVSHGFGRFAAITLIIALGVGFMIGIMQFTPSARISMDTYLRDANVYNVSLKAGYGFTDEDVEAVREVTDSEGKSLSEVVMPYITSDVMTDITHGNAVMNLATRIYGVDFEALQSDGGVNRLTVVDGRLPEKAGECVVQRANTNTRELSVGDTVKMPDELTASNSLYGDIYTDDYDSLEVVGIVSSPEFYYFDAKEITTIGTGVIGAVVYTFDSFYELEKNLVYSLLGTSYTDVGVVLNGTDKFTAFTDSYDEYVMSNTAYYSALAGEIKNAQTEKLGEMLSSDVASLLSDSAQVYALSLISSNYSYVGFSMNVEKVKDVAGVFPVFFIIVAALVALTSMSRMIDEQRGDTGTFKALGYSNARIVNKYVIYCCLATILGVGIGAAFGFSVLPIVLWTAYGILYYLPKFIFSFSPTIFFVTLVVALAVTVLVTLYASRSVIFESPAQMMQAKAPKPGKKIFLERIPVFWNRLKFSQKATIRNIFRYKRNMVLTIISIMGCTALIFGGFGFSDSIVHTLDIQYDSLQTYDFSFQYNREIDDESFLEFLDANYCYNLYTEDGTVVIDSKTTGTQSVTLFGIPAGDEGNERSLREFYAVADTDGNEITLEGADVAICENYAREYGIKVGDPLTYMRTDGTEINFIVSAVVENYSGGILLADYDYLIEKGFASGYNTYLVTLTDDYIDAIEEEYSDLSVYLTEKLFSYDGVASISFLSDAKAVYEGLISILTYLRLVLIVCAALLAAVVLYNLTNINIEERRQEIATLKVLGYTRPEVAGYVYRESAVLVVAGSILGLGLGALLTWFVATRISNPAFMVSFFVSWWVYIVAFALTCAFAAIVYACMVGKLNKIEMADSLKPNE